MTTNVVTLLNISFSYPFLSSFLFFPLIYGILSSSSFFLMAWPDFSCLCSGYGFLVFSPQISPRSPCPEFSSFLLSLGQAPPRLSLTSQPLSPHSPWHITELQHIVLALVWTWHKLPWPSYYLSACAVVYFPLNWKQGLCLILTSYVHSIPNVPWHCGNPTVSAP